jgi:hypothetical protein
MAKIYLVRHQAQNVVHQFPFAQPPTPEQLAAVSRFCFQSWGRSHEKTPDEPYWVKVIEVDLLGPNDVPDVPDRALSLSKENIADPDKFVVAARGHVENPKK